MLFFDDPISYFCDIIKYYTMTIKRTYRYFFPKSELTRQITILASNMVLTQGHKLKTNKNFKCFL